MRNCYPGHGAKLKGNKNREGYSPTRKRVTKAIMIPL